MEIPFVGGSYEGKSKNLNAQVCQNLYPVVDQQGGKSVLGLYNVPGTTSYINLGEGKRYLVQLSGNLYFNKNLLTLPQLNYLIAWYKFDEGSGLVAYNSATDGSLGGGLLPNLTVNNGDGNFWSYLAGFGSSITTGDSPSLDYAYKQLAAERSLSNFAAGGHTFGTFFRAKEPSIVGGHPLNMHQYFDRYGSFFTTEASAGIGSVILTVKGSTSTIYDIPVFNQWHFLFLPDDSKLRVINPDGTLLTDTVAMSIGVSLINYIHVGVATTLNADGSGSSNNSCNGSFGDMLIYNAYMPTMVQWAIWYDQLRGRYGMAARSGW